MELSLKARTVGVMLDADAEGVTARQNAVRDHFKSSIASAAQAEHGAVVLPPNGQTDRRRFGLWVAPDGTANGSLDDVMRQAADAMHPN